MTDIRKAAEMALDALELGDDISAEQMSDVLEALRQALAHPEQEPVAWLGVYKGIASELAFQDFDIVVGAGWTRLPLYTSPPKREWVGLKDADIAETMRGNVEGSNMLPYSFARAIEAKLKEKNT